MPLRESNLKRSPKVKQVKCKDKFILPRIHSMENKTENAKTLSSQAHQAHKLTTNHIYQWQWRQTFSSVLFVSFHVLLFFHSVIRLWHRWNIPILTHFGWREVEELAKLNSQWSCFEWLDIHQSIRISVRQTLLLLSSSSLSSLSTTDENKFNFEKFSRKFINIFSFYRPLLRIPLAHVWNGVLMQTHDSQECARKNVIRCEMMAFLRD